MGSNKALYWIYIYLLSDRWVINTPTGPKQTCENYELPPSSFCGCGRVLCCHHPFLTSCLSCRVSLWIRGNYGDGQGNVDFNVMEIETIRDLLSRIWPTPPTTPVPVDLLLLHRVACCVAVAQPLMLSRWCWHTHDHRCDFCGLTKEESRHNMKSIPKDWQPLHLSRVIHTSTCHSMAWPAKTPVAAMRWELLHAPTLSYLIILFNTIFRL